MALFPALHIDDANGDGDLILAVVDDFQPSAVEDRSDSWRVFFPSPTLRAQARDALNRAMPHLRVTDCDVDDEDWARRSQADLPPVVVGRLTIRPAVDSAPTGSVVSADSLEPPLVIRPSMGFGTGHHATTRLCLAALQTLDLVDAFLLDVGTGSGILALAGRRLGATLCLGIDSDADAVQSAVENLPLNPTLDAVRFEVADLDGTQLPVADVVTANLTGALLVRSADTLTHALAPGGHLIVSGLLREEARAVREAFAELALIWEQHEGEWVGLCYRSPARSPR